MMKRLAALPLLVLALGIVALPLVRDAAGQSGSGSAGWITLFGGVDMSGWTPIGDANWRVADGMLEADKGSGFLVSKGSYTDFQIRAEFWVDADANSGVFLRCSDRQKITSGNAYEVNVFDNRPDPTFGTGAIVDVAKPATTIKAAGHWNTYEITARGSHFTVILNGVTTVADAVDTRHASGPIALQYFAGIVKFRKVEIKPL